MNKSLLAPIPRLLRFIMFLFIDFLIGFSKRDDNQKSLLLIRLDSIGDYLLVHNFFHFIKQSEKYKGYKVTLCGNREWKDLAETFDKEAFNDFIWIDRDKFHTNPMHKYKVLKDIYKRSFETVIDTTYSREILFGDSIVKTSRAKERIGSEGAGDPGKKWKRNLFTDKYFTKLIPADSNILFEFNRNKHSFESILKTECNLVKPSINVSGIDLRLPTNNKFIVIFPGAREEKRRWSVEKFAFVIQTLINKTQFDIIIAGSSADSKIARRLVFCFNSKRVFDLTGKTTLPEFAKLISLSKLLISNETSSVHFAASVGTPFVCISNGQRFGRFMPYPVEMNVLGEYVFPTEIENKLYDIRLVETKYKFDSDLNINLITPGKVLLAVSKVLNGLANQSV